MSLATFTAALAESMYRRYIGTGVPPGTWITLEPELRQYWIDKATEATEALWAMPRDLLLSTFAVDAEPWCSCGHRAADHSTEYGCEAEYGADDGMGACDCEALDLVPAAGETP